MNVYSSQAKQNATKYTPKKKVTFNHLNYFEILFFCFYSSQTVLCEKNSNSILATVILVIHAGANRNEEKESSNNANIWIVWKWRGAVAVADASSNSHNKNPSKIDCIRKQYGHFYSKPFGLKHAHTYAHASISNVMATECTADELTKRENEKKNNNNNSKTKRKRMAQHRLK